MNKRPLFFGLAIVFAAAGGIVYDNGAFEFLSPAVRTIAGGCLALFAGICFVVGAAVKDDE